MKRLIELLRNRHEIIYRAFLFLVASLLMVYLLPKEARFKYDLTNIKGKPWNHENLIAPFNFSVLKSVNEIADDERRALADFHPCVRIREDALSEAKKNYRLRFEKEFKMPDSLLPDLDQAGLVEPPLPGDPFDHYFTGAKLLDTIFHKGIVAEQGSDDEIMQLVRGNLTEETFTSDFFTPLSADSFIQSQLKAPGKFDVQKLSAVIAPLIQPNVEPDSALTAKFRTELLSSVSPYRGGKAQDQIVIGKGELVDDVKYQELLSLKSAYESQPGGMSGWLGIGGQGILVVFCLSILFLFLWLFRTATMGSDSKVLFILLMMVLTVAMSRLPEVFENIPAEALPFCILPVVMRAFFDTRTALFAHLLTILLLTLNVHGERYEFVFIQIIAGIGAIFSIVNMRNRSQIFFSVLMIFGAYSVTFFGLMAALDGDFKNFEPIDLLYFGISAFLVLLAYPLIYLFEKIFGFVSDVTLLELSDTNHPLLRELASKAPGTFQHSLQVANLAEEAIHRIGGNALLVRTGALFHDIGKSESPMFFIENQVGDINPHDELSFEESASIIISHVAKGIAKAKSARLPDPVIDFIRTHHGTTNTAYFLTLYKKKNPDQYIDEELFRYPGPIPYSKETAVVMMADSVEAASRSLKKFDGDTLDRLVERVISNQMEQNQFVNCDITFRDIAVVKTIFKKKMRSIYHARVEYPRM